MKGSIDKRSKGVYRLRISLGIDPSSGKRLMHVETFHGKRENADKRLRELVEQFQNQGQVTKPATLSLKEYLAQWLKAKKPSVKARTHSDYEELMQRYIVPEVGQYPIRTLTPLLLQGMISTLLDRTLSPSTIRKTITVLSQALKQAVSWQMLPYNPCTGLQLPRLNSRRAPIRAMTLEQARAFLDAVKEDPRGFPLTFSLDTGLRPGELLGLFWSDIDWKAGQASVERSLSPQRGGGWILETPKTAKSHRRVSLPPELLEELRQHRSRQLQERLALGPAWKGTHDFVFPASNGAAMAEPNLVKRHFKPALKRAGLPSTFRLYDLRHTCATQLLMAGVHVKIVSERLGHESTAFTMDRYTHVLANMQDHAVENLSRLFHSRGTLDTGSTTCVQIVS